MKDPHKHRWTEAFGDKDAYEPDDITASWETPSVVWQQFCAEVHILHTGELRTPSQQREMWA